MHIGYTEDMANVVDPQNFVAPSISVPGLKPPVRDFSPIDDGDLSKVAAFNAMIRGLRYQDLAVRPDAKWERSAG